MIKFNHDNFFAEARVRIFIGENGAGKSTMLNNIAETYLSEGRNVIGIANSIHDKFSAKSKRLSFFGARRGRAHVLRTVKHCIYVMSKDNSGKRLSSLFKILEHLGYETGFSVSIIGYRPEEIFSRRANYISLVDSTEDEDFDRFLARMENYHNLEIFRENFWFGPSHSFQESVETELFLEMIKWESHLRKMGLLQAIEISLDRTGRTHPLRAASSGQLALIMSTIFISSVIKENTAILIDEPENSLHPKWQKEYISILSDYFYQYAPEITIATHSPIIVSGVSANSKRTTICKMTSYGEFSELEPGSLNLEQMMYELFEVPTPENRFLSNLLVSKLNELGEGKLQLHQFEQEVNKLESLIYDERQKGMLESVRQLAQKVDADK